MQTFWLVVACLIFAYPFAVYPLLLRLLARRKIARLSTPAAGRLEAADCPTVALVICALNEEKVIGKKLENCLALRYPKDRQRIVVVSDGSTDRTAEIVREYCSRGIELIENERRRGKVANLNLVLPARREEILALSDANVIYDPDSLYRLVSRFRDPSVGCVSGKVILTDSAPELDRPTNDYYSIEWLLQEKSSLLYSMAGADGAMYALRRELFVPCPNDTLIEDFVIPMNVVRRGFRVVFEPSAVGWEQGPASLQEEFRRKVRIAAGAFQGLVRGNVWPANAPLRFWLVFISHKLLRWLSPVAGALALSLALASSGQLTSRLVLVGSALIAFLALLRPLTGWAHPLVSAPFYFVFGQVALAWGMLKGLAGRQTVLWAKADR